MQDLDQETLNRIDYQNQVQTLLEEIDFIRRVHDQEINELQAMASRDTTPENREYFKNELASAIRDIRAEYDQVRHYGRSMCCTFNYLTKTIISKIKNEVSRNKFLFLF